MVECDLQALLAQACSNKFSCLDDKAQRAILLQLLCEIVDAGGGAEVFVSAETPFSALSTLYTFPHGLGAMPNFFRAVIVNQSADLGYTAGKEVDFRGVFHTGSGSEFSSVYADATNIYVSLREAVPSAAITRLTLAAGGVPLAAPDYTKWTLKVYASL